MTRLKWTVAILAITAVIILSATRLQNGESKQIMNATAGRWTCQLPDGATVDLELRDDGTFSVLTAPWTAQGEWRIEDWRLFLGDDEWTITTWDGSHVVAELDGQRVVMDRRK